jgi:histidine triad (HIT) family protein
MSGNLALPEAYPCAFCDYLAGRRPYTILYRNTLAAVLVTREQRGVPHLLVIPTRHVPTILDMDIIESYALIEQVQLAAKAIDASEQRRGISIWQNNGIDAHQAVPHLHFHVAGTVPGGGTEWESVSELTIDETDRIAIRLKPHFGVDSS